MRLKDLFSVPKEQRITDKYLCRVLACSICGILLCMGCLAGTTWAWFAVSIENVENVIQIGEPTVNVTVDGKKAESGISLPVDTYVVTIEHGSEKDSLSKRPTLYVTLTIGEATEETPINGDNGTDQQTDEVTTEETPTNGDNGTDQQTDEGATEDTSTSNENDTQQQTGKGTTAYVELSDETDCWTVTIAADRSVCLSWEVSWDKPENIPELSDEIDMIEKISPQKPDSGMETIVESENQNGGAGDPVESDPPNEEQGPGEGSETPNEGQGPGEESGLQNGGAGDIVESDPPDDKTETDKEPETQSGESGLGEEPTGSTVEVTNENVA